MFAATGESLVSPLLPRKRLGCSSVGCSSHFASVASIMNTIATIRHNTERRRNVAGQEAGSTGGWWFGLGPVSGAGGQESAPGLSAASDVDWLREPGPTRPRPRRRLPSTWRQELFGRRSARARRRPARSTAGSKKEKGDDRKRAAPGGGFVLVRPSLRRGLDPSDRNQTAPCPRTNQTHCPNEAKLPTFWCVPERANEPDTAKDPETKGPVSSAAAAAAAALSTAIPDERAAVGGYRRRSQGRTHFFALVAAAGGISARTWKVSLLLWHGRQGAPW
jgi:hypothetical protein